jgi:hypothetical protein
MFNLIVIATIFTLPNFLWESPADVEYVELVCNGVSVGWRLAADGELTPRPTDFVDGTYSCVFRAYNTDQVFIDQTPPFVFTMDTNPTSASPELQPIK